MVVVLNIVLALFNLIPIPPLDGSKILFALIPYRWRGVGEIMERYQLVLILFVILAAGSWLWPVVNLVFTFLTGLRL
jgi:Zn-dependent protease